jgi:uncharacterized membrane protein YdjX (TVP38/TMEM64 family)
MTPLVKNVLRGLVTIAVLVGVGFAVQKGWFGELFTEEWIDANVRGAGLRGELIYLFGSAALVSVGFPRQIISFMGGYAFGLVLGSGLALLATAMGCVISFSFARFAGRDYVSRKFPRRLQIADDFLRENTFATTLLIRLLPLGSNFVTNLVAGVSGAGAVAFVTGSALGYIPQTVIFALLGSGIGVEQELRITVSIVLFVISAALGVYLYRRYRQGRELTTELD